MLTRSLEVFYFKIVRASPIKEICDPWKSFNVFPFFFVLQRQIFSQADSFMLYVDVLLFAIKLGLETKRKITKGPMMLK